MGEPTGDPQLGRRIARARKRAGLTQERLLDLLPSAPPDRPKSWLSNIERGNRGLSAHDLAEIAEALKVPADELLFGERRPTDEEGLVVYALRRAQGTARQMFLASARAIAEEEPEYHEERPPGDEERRRAGRP